MTRRTFKIAALALGGLVMLAASVDAATAGPDAPSMVEQAMCHACAFISGLLH